MSRAPPLLFCRCARRPLWEQRHSAADTSSEPGDCTNTIARAHTARHTALFCTPLSAPPLPRPPRLRCCTQRSARLRILPRSLGINPSLRSASFPSRASHPPDPVARRVQRRGRREERRERGGQPRPHDDAMMPQHKQDRVPVARWVAAARRRAERGAQQRSVVEAGAASALRVVLCPVRSNAQASSGDEAEARRGLTDQCRAARADTICEREGRERRAHESIATTTTDPPPRSQL